MLLLHWHFFAQIWFALLGAAVGSFLNVVIYRVPAGFLLTRPSRSCCMKCKRKLTWFENIPVFSYLFLRGRCAGCQQKISLRYPLVEFVCSVLFVAVYRYFGLTGTTFYYCGFVAALLAVTFIDIDHRIIPDVISLPGTAIGLALSFWIDGLGFYSSLLGAALGGGFFWAMGWGYEKLTGREGIGFGDVKLLAMIGAFLGPQGVFGTIVISSFIGSVVGIALMVIQKKDLKLAVPYGPFLALGAITCLFWGDYIAFRIYPLSL